MIKALRCVFAGVVATAAIAGALVVTAAPAGATTVTDEATFRAAWMNAGEIQIDLANDIMFGSGVGCGAAVRNSTTAITVNGNGFTITQTCTSMTNPNSAVLQNTNTGAITLENLTITGGESTVGGAGVTSAGDITVSNSTITGNESTGGGGGVSTSGNVTVTNSMITANKTEKSGAGVSAGLTLTVSGSTISGNSSGGIGLGFGGSGLFAPGAITITNSTISDNGPTEGPGGGVLGGAGGVTATNSTFTLNDAETGGAAISTPGTVSLTNSTVSGNTGSGTVGAVSGTAGVNLVYSTIVSNTSGTSANITAPSRTSFGSVVALPLGGGTNCSAGTTTSNGWNFSDDTSCGFTNTTSGDNQNGNPGLGPLADNGGPTQTHMPARPGPLVDAIPTESCQADGAAGITTDQRGVTRPQGPGCDIGAVEAPPPPAAPKVCPRRAGASLGGGSLAGAEGVFPVAPLGLQALFRRRRRGVGNARSRAQQVRTVVTWLMVAGVAIAVLAACQPLKKC
jgi:hypothetical protein